MVFWFYLFFANENAINIFISFLYLSLPLTYFIGYAFMRLHVSCRESLNSDCFNFDGESDRRRILVALTYYYVLVYSHSVLVIGYYVYLTVGVLLLKY